MKATVHNISDIVLAVLFGGQNFEVFKFSITEAQKEQLVKDMAQSTGQVLRLSSRENLRLPSKRNSSTLTPSTQR
jgi:methylmalonyl-CoA mutase cobalamin-binding subunit